MINKLGLLLYHDLYFLHFILTASEVFGWKTLKDRTNSPNSIWPLPLTSKRSNICMESKFNEEIRIHDHDRQASKQHPYMSVTIGWTIHRRKLNCLFQTKNTRACLVWENVFLYFLFSLIITKFPPYFNSFPVFKEYSGTSVIISVKIGNENRNMFSNLKVPKLELKMALGISFMVV